MKTFNNSLQNTLALLPLGRGGAGTRRRQSSSRLDPCPDHRVAREDTELLLRGFWGWLHGCVLRHRHRGPCSCPLPQFSLAVFPQAGPWILELVNKLLFVSVFASSCHQESITQSHVSSPPGAQCAFCFIRLRDTASLRCPNWFTYY